MTQHRWKNHHV